MRNLTSLIHDWIIAAVGIVATAAAAYLGSHHYPQSVREIGSAVLATMSGLVWIVSALQPSRSVAGRNLNFVAAALAALSGIFLLP